MHLLRECCVDMRGRKSISCWPWKRWIVSMNGRWWRRNGSHCWTILDTSAANYGRLPAHRLSHNRICMSLCIFFYAQLHFKADFDPNFTCDILTPQGWSWAWSEISHYHTAIMFNNRFMMALCPGLPGWAGTRSNIHPLTPLLIINHSLSASSIYYDP